MCHVLILDDDELFGRTLGDSLRHATDLHFDVIASTSPEAARQAVETANSPFDAFLVDQRLRDGVDGIEVAQELMQLSPNTSLIVFTGYDDPEVGLRAYQAHAYRYLPKPFQTRELIHILRTMREWRTTLNEHNWLRILNEIAEQAQQALSVQTVGDICVRGGLQLGFERAQLWLMLEDGQHLRCISQAGCEVIAYLADFVMPVDESIYSSEVLQGHEPAFFQSREQAERFLERLSQAAGFQPPVGEWAAIPLRAGDRRLGMLVLDNADQPARLSTDKRHFLKLFGNQVAVAVERARLFELERRRSEELAVLNQIGRDVTAIDDLDELLQQVRTSVGRLMKVDNFRIALVDEETQQLDFRLCVDNGKSKTPYVRKIHEGLIGYLIAHNQPVRLLNGTHDFRVEHGIRLLGREAKSWLGVPLRVGSQAVGAITVQDYQHAQVFSQKDEELLMAVADQVAGVIKTARLKEREVRNAQQLQVLHHAGEIIMKLAEVNEDWLWHATLTVTTAQYGLSFNRAILLLSEDNGRRLRGHLGIGHFDPHLARRDWKRDLRNALNFDDYVTQLVSDRLKRTPIETTVREMIFQVTSEDNALNEVLHQKRRIVVHATEVCQHLPEQFCQQFGLTDYALVPLRAGERVLGLVIVDNFIDQEPLSPPDLNRLESFLAQAALIAENVRQRRAQDQLLNLNYAIIAESNSGPLKDVLERVAQGAYSLSAPDCVAIYPLKPARLPYEYDDENVVAIGRHTLRQLSEQPRPRGITGHILRAGTLVVPDVQADATRYDGLLLRDNTFIQQEGVRALIGLPLRDITTGDMLGVMYLDYRTPKHFELHDVRLAELFANLAAAAIRSSHATQQMRDGWQAAEIRGQATDQELRQLSTVLQEAVTTSEQDNLIRTLLTAVHHLLHQPDLRIGVMLHSWAVNRDPEPREIRRQYYLNEDSTVTSTEEDDIYRGIVGEAIRAKKSQLVPDVLQPEWQQVYHSVWPETRSELVVPIKLGGQVLGALNVESPRADALTTAHQVTLERLADTAALALDNLRRQAHLHSILEAAKAVTIPTTLEQTFEEVVRVIREIVPELSSLTIWYRQSDSEVILPGPSFGVYDQAAMSEGPPAAESTVCRVMQLPQAIWASEAADESQLRGRFIHAEHIVSSAAFPLWADNEAVGAMFFNYRQRHDFTTEERTLFPILATIVAASVRDATHLKAAENARRRLDIAYEIATAVGPSLEATLSGVLATLNRQFPDIKSCVLTYDDVHEQLKFLPASRQFYHIDEPGQQDLTTISIYGPSIASYVARLALISGQIVVENVGHVENDERFMRLIQSTQSELCFSLMSSHGELMGILALERVQAEPFDEEDQALMRYVAQQIGQALERVRQSEQLSFRGTVAAATAWAADIAHEINNEVGLIRNRILAIQRKLDPAASVHALLRKIDESADRLAGTLRGNFLKGSAAKEYEIDSVLQRHCTELAGRNARPIDLSFDLSSPGQYVQVSPAVLERVLHHLMRNAVEAAADLPELHIMVHSRLFRDRWVEVQVEDSGPGVPEEQRASLFQIPSHEGRGYGLLFVRTAVEEMGGKVWYTPRRDGLGSNFSFTVPIVLPPNPVEVEHGNS